MLCLLAKIEEFMSTPAGRFLGMAGLAILTAVLTYIAAQTPAALEQSGGLSGGNTAVPALCGSGQAER